MVTPHEGWYCGTTVGSTCLYLLSVLKHITCGSIKLENGLKYSGTERKQGPVYKFGY